MGASDSPRWCSVCNAWGDHHTDRHPAEGGDAHAETDVPRAGTTTEHEAQPRRVSDRGETSEVDRLRSRLADAHHNMELLAEGRDRAFDVGYRKAVEDCVGALREPPDHSDADPWPGAPFSEAADFLRERFLSVSSDERSDDG